MISMNERGAQWWFEEQAAQRPDALAVVFADKEVTYAELNGLADRLAHNLRRLGVGPDVLVGICAERSVEMVAGLLGILKAGGAYVPLDPAYPADRLRYMLEDAAVPVLLTQAHLADRLPDCGAEVVCLEQAMQGEEQPLPQTVRADDLAYVIYTSGSTGRPKGVMLTHRGMCNMIRATVQLFDVREDSRLLQFASFSFDAATNEIFTALSAGGTLYLARQEELMPGPGLIGLLKNLAITHVTLPPSVLAMLPDEFPHLRTVVSAGENCPLETASRWARGRRFVNAYGPTEATVCASAAVYVGECQNVTIGQAIEGVELFVLDRQMRQVQAGAEGELHIGGPGLARGYLHRPELTAEKFVPHPFSEDSEQRLYKTGDLVRLLTDGTLEFLGRIDQQVKIRGFRIELGEIEATLVGHERLREAVLLAREDAPGEPKLVAYVVPHAGQEAPRAVELRRFLQDKLPDYMVPAFFVVLDRFPLTPNGKVDRRALPAPDARRGELESEFVRPRTPLEVSLQQIWQDVLGLDGLGVHDPFLELGGHSLQAVQILARVREQLDVEIGLHELFAKQTIALLAEELEAKRLAGTGVSNSFIPRVPRKEEIPVSSAQERVWFVHKMNPDNRAYAAQAMMRLQGDLRRDVLERALTAVVERHEMFRTTFQEADGRPAQKIHPPFAVKVPVVSLLAVPVAERESCLTGLMQDEMARPFDMRELPLVRWTLYQVGAQEHVLLHIEHHMVHDGWSYNVFLREFTALYNAFRNGQASPLAEMPVQFADFAHWQRSWLQSVQAQEQVQYWQQKLAGCNPVLELPSDRPRPALPSHRGGAVRVDLPAKLCERLTAMGRQEGVTLYVTLLTAFKVLLYRYTGQNDLLVGSAVANRRLRDTEGLIGMIVNNVVLRTQLDGDVPFRELLGQVRAMAYEAFAHEDLPFDKLVEAVNPVRDTSRNPLIQVMFSFHDSPLPKLDLQDLTVQVKEALNNGSAKFDLNVVGLPLQEARLGESEHGAGGLTLIWEYSSDLFEEATIRRMIGHYLNLLEHAVAEPETQVALMRLLEEREAEQIMTAWNRTEAGGVPDLPLHALFEAQAARTPDRTAVVFQEQCLTYRELNRQANRLARHLRKLGIAAEEKVGLCAERSPQMLVGLLGILKAGGAYVPLDPEYPQERLAFLMRDARMAVVVTESSQTEWLKAVAVEAHQSELDGLQAEKPDAEARIGNLQLVCLDGGMELWSQGQGADLELPITADRLAYMIYTSGSTGKPKGVQVEHRNVVNFLHSMQQRPGVEMDDVLLAVTSLSFDIAALELFLPLVTGAKTVLADRATAADGKKLAALLARSGATMMQATPVTWRLLVEAGWRSAGRVKMLCGGEALPADLARSLTADDSELWNLYGPTETTIWSTCTRIEPDFVGTPSIGSPIANTNVYVLDARLQPVPVGVPGELCIGGAGVARGYWNRAELTAETFISHELGRLYRTGDRVRLLTDGRLQYLERMDHQIKLRGLRIELGEIEARLHLHPRVQHAVVAVQGDSHSDKRLVGYVVPRGLEAPTAQELRTYLKASLPEYMVPSAVLMLDALPLTPNGKVDRRALPAPDAQAATGEYLAPRNERERQAAEIFAQLLKRERVGVTDNFFALGGHSLLALQAVSRLSIALGVEVPFRAVFEEPTVAGLLESLDGLAQQQRAAHMPMQLPQIDPLPRGDDEVLPLSFAQQRLWVLEQMLGGSAAYHFPYAMRLQGELEVSTLARSVQALVHRHEALRTTFQERNGQLVQVIGAAEPMLLPAVTVHEDDLPELMQAEAGRPFDLRRGPLFRASLWRISETEHVLLFNMHHIITDGWSYGVLAHELSALYANEPLAPLPVQYADFAAAQRNWMQGEVLETQLAYWKRQLDGELPVLELPTDHPRPAVQTYNGTFCKRELPSRLTERLRAFSQQRGVTLYMTLLAAFQTLLHRYTGQEDLLVGSPIAGRNRQEVEGLIGFFVNTLVLRTDLAGNPSFDELLRRVRETVLGAFAHQDVPFERLVEELQPERVLSHSPLFQVSFQLLSAWQVELQGLDVQSLEVQTSTAKYDLSVAVIEEGDQLALRFDYNTDLFERAMNTRMMEHFRVLLEGIVAEPDQRIGMLPLLTAEERELVLGKWNETAVQYPRECTVHELFERQAERTPDAVAVVYGEQTLTYAELNRRANRVAHELRARGVAPDQPVAIYMERSAELIIGLLAIMKAGGAYLPLDPEYPQERIALMLEDAAAALLLTQSHLANSLPAHTVQIVCLDARWEKSIGDCDTNLQSGTTAEHLAYITYTSGSTGRPKGVCIPHRAVVRLVTGTDYAEFAPEDVFLQFASISFDAATYEIWGSLLNGARLVVYPAGKATLQELGRVIQAQRVTTLWLTAGLFHQMVEEQLPQLAAVKQLLAGGDVLSVPHVKRVLQHLPGLTLINGYGPTESTTFACCYSMTHAEQAGTAVPIGRPIANTQVYVLDRRLQPVPVGVPGELYLGGDGLAREYLNLPEITAEKFIEHPFSSVADAKLYRTGDQVKYLPDGNLEFLGRLDQQVKIRGFRIETGEVEAQLLASSSVRETVVTVYEPNVGDKRLAAYVVPAHGVDFDESALRQELKGRLPGYMLPSVFVALERLPLTRNGKVDLQALPEPQQAVSELMAEPRNQDEAWGADLFAELLGTRVGITDNFFERGGHSLAATRAISRLRAVYGVELSLQAFFEDPTVAGVMQKVQALQGAAAQMRIVPVPREQTLPLSFAQRRLWFFDQFEPGNPVYNIPVALRLTGDLDVPALARSLQEIAARHEALRTVFADQLGEPSQVILSAPDSFLTLETRDVETLIGEEQRHAFDLQNGPLFRARLVQAGEREHVLILNLHHIAADGWSIGVLARELSALYSSRSLESLPVQYADFAVWQREWLQGAVLERQLGYWREQLGGNLPLLQLPADRPRPAVRTYHGAGHRMTLAAGLSQAIHALCKQEGVTLFMTLLTAFKTLLHRYSGLQDILVGSPVAGRNRAEIEGLIGFFVKTLVLRSDLSGDPSFRELLGRVRKMTLAAFDHQDVPFERLVDELQPERHASISPLFQVMFVLQNAVNERWELPGLAVEQLKLEQQTAKFDLTLSVAEDGAELGVHVEYNTDLYDRATIERLCGHYETLLQGIVADPGQKISALPLLTASERYQVLVEWNSTEIPIANVCLHELIEEQVQCTPHLVAAVYGEQELTYAELDEQANRLAHHLIAHGVGPNVPVGVCMERSLELVVALVGILKAGGAYVPLDTDAPTARIRQVLEDSRAAVCVTQMSLLAKLPVETIQYVCLDPGSQVLQTYPVHAPHTAVTPDNLISIYYTSGSTGKPKGVCSTHRGWVNRMLWMQRQYQLQPKETVLQKTTLTFDDAACEFYWPLLVGGRIALLEPGLHKDPRAILDAAIRDRAAFLTFVPSMLALFVEAVTPEDRARLQHLRHVGSSGEALRSDLVRRFREQIGCALHNTWGATEVSIDSTIHTCTAEDEHAAEIVSVGHPIDNNRCYVLDEQLQPVPIGVPGDLYLGGIGLAVGYLNDPERTAAAFLPNPFVEGERLYKTGDRGFFRADGSIMFLGRRDDQIKVRGQRVELAEIEAVLATHPDLQQAAVAAFKRPDGYLLAAYCVLTDPLAQVNTESLRAFMSDRLPDYMVPWRFVRLDTLPTTVSGKVDRKQLPDPGDERPELEEAFVAPGTHAERTVATIWQEILEVNQVGVRDNFFALGGHSLSATRIISRVNRELEVQLPLRDLFESPTVAGLAEKADRSAGAGQAPIPRFPKRTEFPLSHAQQRFWFQYQFDPESMAAGAMNLHLLDGPLDAEQLLRAYRALTKRHSIMRTMLAERAGEGTLQIVHEEVAEPIRFVDLTELPEAERGNRLLRILADAKNAPFDLTRDFFFRACLLKLSDRQHVLLCNIHPIAYDGWSITVFFRDLAALYQGAELPAALQYGEYALWQHEQLADGKLNGQKAYWLQQLALETGPPALTHDFAMLPEQTERVTDRRLTLGPALAAKLRVLAAEQGTTLYLTLLTGLKIWLALTSRQELITVCSPIAGRSHPDLESVLGLMVNPLALRTDLADNPTALQVLERVKETAFGAYANQDYPFDLILHDLRARRGGELGESLYNIVFVGQNAHLDAVELAPGVTLRYCSFEELIGSIGIDPSAEQAQAAKERDDFADDPTVEFDLHIEAYDTEDSLTLVAAYNAKRFTSETVDRLLSEYESVLQQFANDCTLRLSQMQLPEPIDLF
ncbi:amino acid adenylation domain-containing protein [Tumebacillus sp. BK434]|uniref:non-ribosomal peptide synthetase n=1 Tax=Tumebacillus sp. BK434 TaxID=2512169 RepID=UPI00104A779C|nr:non-ribosomal peptide synthetase [Tumebacillus sp. BK434]TCP59201.1 amino acid adenylation domain-containing protein [Tumebacillus sp. BK434]